MLINRRNAMMAGKRLPYDAEVEYLESTGTQWIDTGIVPQNSMHIHVEMSAALANPAVYFGCFGAGVSDLRYGPQWALKRYYRAVEIGHQRHTRWTDNSATNAIRAALANLATLDFTMPPDADSSSISLDIAGGAYTLVSGYNFGNTGLPPRDIALFGGGSPAGGIAFLCPASEKLKIGVFKLYSANATLVRDFTSVRFTNELGQSEGAMYDRANPTVGMNPDGSARTDGLYRNRGTGAFLMGSDKSAVNGGGYKLRCPRRSYRRSSRPSARFYTPRLWKEVA